MNDSENFKEVLDRVLKTIDKIKKINSGINYIISHGMFIKILIFAKNNAHLFKDREKLNHKEIMSEFLKINFTFSVKNIEVIDITDLADNF